MDIKKVTGVYFSPAGSTKRPLLKQRWMNWRVCLRQSAGTYHSTRRLTVRRSISLPRMSWSYSAVRCMPVGCRTRFRRTLLAACTVRVHRRWCSLPTAAERMTTRLPKCASC